MGVDLKDQIAQVLTPDVARQLASTVGMDDRQGKTFVDAAIAALLATLVNVLDRPDAAHALSEAISNSDPNAIEKLRRALAARNLQALSAGASPLIPVLGQGVRDKLAAGLADLVETPVKAAVPALGAVEQAAVAVIGQQDPSLWSDGDAIKKLIMSQKSAPAAATTSAPALAEAPPTPVPPPPAPPTSAPPTPAPPPAASTTLATPPSPAPAAVDAVSPAPAPRRALPPPPPPPPPSGGMTWIIVIVVILILIAGYYYWTSRQSPASGSLPAFSQFASLTNSANGVTPPLRS